MRLPAVARAGVPRRARAASSGALPRDLRQAGARRERPDRHAAARHRAFLQLGGAFPPETVSPQRILPAANRRAHTRFQLDGKTNPSGGGPMASSPSRRNFIRKTAALTGSAFAAAGAARAAPLPVPSTNREPGRIIDEAAYGMPSKFEGHVKRRRTDVLKNRLKPASTTVQQTHGLLSGALWTGVPMSTLLDEAGIDPRGKWALLEGADASAHTRSVPMEKMLDDALIVYAMNGEALRPENGYPVRALLPGWEGNISVKWLRRIKIGEQPWHFRSETARYTDPMPDGKWRQFSMVMETKSVITNPSGGMNLKGPGFYEVTGLAWSGSGKVRAVDVSF